MHYSSSQRQNRFSMQCRIRSFASVRVTVSAEEIAGMNAPSSLIPPLWIVDLGWVTASSALPSLSATGGYGIQSQSTQQNLLCKTPNVAIESITLANKERELRLRNWNLVEKRDGDLALRRAHPIGLQAFFEFRFSIE